MLKPPQNRLNIEGWLHYIEALDPTKIDLGLERISTVANLKGWNDFSIPVVTFAGTNGKGSTIAALESLLSHAGCRVATYTSPHLIHFNERIRLHGHLVDDRSLANGFAEVEAARVEAGVDLTYFEFTTLVALFLFQEHAAELDCILLEVGLGGRLDAVNCVDADIAVITQIDFDHTDWLGDTLEAIGAEKAGIMRPGQTVIVADEDPPRSVLGRARELQVNLIDRTLFSAKLNHPELSEFDAAQSWDWVGVHRGRGLKGEVERSEVERRESEQGEFEPIKIAQLPTTQLPLISVATALQILCVLSKSQLNEPSVVPIVENITEESIRKAIKCAALPGRMTYVSSSSHLGGSSQSDNSSQGDEEDLSSQQNVSAQILLDVAHNPQSVRRLTERLKQWRAGQIDHQLGSFKGGKIVAIFGAMKDKAILEMVKEIGAVIDEWVPVQPEGARAYPLDDLKRDLMSTNQIVRIVDLPPSVNSEKVADDRDAAAEIEQMLQSIRMDSSVELLLVFGSFLTVGPALQCFSES